MSEALLKVVLENNPELHVHASKIDAGLIESKVGQKIVTRLPESQVPEGFKLKNHRYDYYVLTEVFAHNIYKTSEQYLTEHGWVSERTATPSELVPIEP